MKNKFLLSLTIAFVLIVVLVIWIFSASNTHKSEIYIKTGDSIDSLYSSLEKSKSIGSNFSFKVAEYVMKFEKVYPGKYIITEVMNNREVINMFFIQRFISM